MTIQEQIKSIMQEKGITAYQLSKGTSIDEGQLSRFFNSKSELSFKKIIQIADFLGCEVKIIAKSDNLK